MHIPDGFVSGGINLTTAAISLGTCAWAVSRANKTLGEKQIPLFGVTAAFIFAAQMLNFPVAAGTSGHFLGALLAAVLLGPLNGCLLMSLVLVVQCLGFADGGLTALGTNIFNMGIVGGICGYSIFATLRSVLPSGRTGFLTSVALASWLSVVLASGLCAVELAVSGTSPFRIVLPAMMGVHAIIGIGEALIGTAALSVILTSRPDLIRAWNQGKSPINTP